MPDVILQWLAQWMSGLWQQLTGYIAALMNSLGTWLSQMVTAVTQFFASIWQTLSNIVTGLIQTINTAITNLLTAIQNIATAIFEKLVGLVESALNKISNFISNAWTALSNFVADIADSLFSFLEQIAQGVEGIIDAAVEAVHAAITNITEGITEAVGAIIETAEQLLSEAKARIEEGFEELITGAEAIIATVNQRIGDLATAFGDAVVALLEGLTDVAGDTVQQLVAPFLRIVEDLHQWASPPETTAFLAQVNKLASGSAGMDDYRSFLQFGWRALAPQKGVWKGIFVTILAASAAIPFLMQFANMSASVAMQELGTQMPWQLLSPADASAAARRGIITEEAAVTEIRKQGFSANDAATILALSLQVPDLDMLLALWNRGEITGGDVVAALKQRGFEEPWIGGLLRFKDVIPPVQDLIMMAVREAFSPDVAAQFGQYQDFPDAIVPWLEKQGVSAEWARRYWAAHWNLPSATQGFEMFQRRIINEEQLNMLLRALDVMPFWREKLTQMSYNVLTRVDARRMHQLGVLDDEGLYNAHLDMGYSPENAQALTLFVQKLNAHAPGEDDEDLGRLSRATILGFYRDGALTKERAIQLLTNLGHTLEAATLLVEDEDFQEERRERKAEKDLVIELAEAGSITFEEAQDRLARLGLETIEQQRALTALLRSQQRRTKLPSKEDALKFFREQLITIEDYAELLSRHGYADRWVRAYVTLAAREAENG